MRRHDGHRARPRPSTPATPIPSSGSSTTSARPWSRATPCTCAARWRRISTRASRRGRRRRRRRPSRRWTTSSCCSTECGATLEHICKATVYLTDIRYREPVYRVLGERLRGRVPRLHRRRGAGAGAAGVAGRGRRRPRSSRSERVTFSLVGRCGRTGMFGTAVTSSSPAVAARCAHARAGVGAAATPERDRPAPRPGRARPAWPPGGRRQQARRRGARRGAGRRVPPADGGRRSGVDRRVSRARTRSARTRSPQGGRTPSPPATCSRRSDVPAAMVEAFAADPGAHLGDAADRARSRAGLDAGGEEGPVRSAGMVVVRPASNGRSPTCASTGDDDPIAELADLWAIWEPQIGRLRHARARPRGVTRLRRPGGRPLEQTGQAPNGAWPHGSLHASAGQPLMRLWPAMMSALIAVKMPVSEVAFGFE